MSKPEPWKISGFKLTGPVDRLIVFLGNLSLGSFVSHYLLSFREFRSLEASLVQFFNPIADTLHLPAEVVSYLPMIFLVSQALIFFFTLIFGRSLFEMMAQMRNSGPWWWQRIGGGARAIIDIFLGPLLIFDLPVILKRPSYKEQLVTSYSLAPIQGTPLRLLLIMPLFLLFTLLAPMMTNFQFIKGTPVVMVEVAVKKLQGGGDFSKYQDVSSELFHFKSFTSFEEGQQWPLPEYNKIRIKNKKRVSPTLLIYDQKNKNYGHWRIKKRISLLALLAMGRRSNPLFSLQFPLINQAIELQRDNPHYYAPRDATTLEDFPSLFTPELQKEIQRFFKVTFELGIDHLIGHTLTYGPFIRGFVEVREALLGLLPKGAKPEVDLMRLGDQNFLRFRQNHMQGTVLGKRVTETYLPIGTENSVLFEMGWDGSLSGALSARTFRESVLAQAKWFFDYKNLFVNRLKQKGNQVSKASALFILDLFVESELDNKEQSLLERVMYRFYFDICRHAIENSQSSFYDVIRDNFGRISSFIEYRNQLAKGHSKSRFSPIFMKKWKALWNGLRLKQEDFFIPENRDINLSEGVKL